MKALVQTFGDFLTEYGLGILYPFFVLIGLFYHPKAYRNPAPTKGIIILVFCWFTPNIAHNKWVTYLEKKGFRTYLVNLPLLFEDFHKSAKRLDTFITKNKLKNYTLVGLSTGAVVCLYFLNFYKKWNETHRFISVGGPLHGTPAARLVFFNKKCRDMLPKSSFIRKLGEISVPPKKMVTISVSYDELIPENSNKWHGAKSYTIPGWGHNSFHLSSSETYLLITKIAWEKR